MTVIYPAVFSREDGTYNVEFPDLPGCLTCSESIENAFFNAKEALSGYAASLLEQGRNLPKATPLSEVPIKGNSFTQLIDVKPAYT